MFYTVYKTTNLLNNKIYICVHKTENIDDDYLGSGTYFQRALNKYGKENFKKEILKVFDNPDDMFKMESLIVNEDFIKNHDNYNIIKGGIGTSFDYFNKNGLNNKSGQCYITGERCKDPEYRKQFAEKVKEGQNRSQKFQETKGKSFLGKHHTDETKKMIGEANSKHQKGAGNSQYGKIWIHHTYLKENNTIPKNDLQLWIDQGWIKGRKKKYFKKK